MGGGEDSGQEPRHPSKKDRRYHSQNRMEAMCMHCKALGGGGSGHNCGEDLGRHSLGLELLHLLSFSAGLAGQGKGRESGLHSLFCEQG